MGSATKNSKTGFKFDPESGKYIPIAVDFRALFPSLAKSQTIRQNHEWSNPRECNDKHSVQPIKFRKTETGVRKELFKVPSPTNYQGTRKLSARDSRSRATGARKSLLKHLPSKNELQRPATKKSESDKYMVLITEEVGQLEEHGRSRISLLKSPMTPQLQLPANSKKDKVKTPDSLKSNADFLRLEQQCQSPTIAISDESPVSSVCNMFESNMLLNSEKKHPSNPPVNQKEIISEIKRSIRINEELYQKTSIKIREILEMQTSQEENLKNIVNLVDKLVDSPEKFSKNENDEEKENSAIKRRSLRLQNKSPAPNVGRPAGSPGILKSGDLRKSTLTKSLVSKYQKYQIDSPRIQKAMEMYNSTRNICSALLTPKISRGAMMTSPTPLNWRNDLSLKVQEQCILLQDTPVHK